MLLRSANRPRSRSGISRGNAGSRIAGRKRHGVAHRPTQAPRPGSPGIVPHERRDAPQVNRLREAIRISGARSGSAMRTTPAGSASRSAARPGAAGATARNAATARAFSLNLKSGLRCHRQAAFPCTALSSSIGDSRSPRDHAITVRGSGDNSSGHGGNTIFVSYKKT